MFIFSALLHAQLPDCMGSFSGDTELLDALKQRDNTAFREVYRLYFRQLCYFSEKITRTRPVSEDIVMETFAKLLENPPGFDSLSRLRSWLFAAARNASLDYLRAEKRHRASHNEIRFLSPPAEEEIGLHLVRSEAIRAIHREIEKLPYPCRQIVKHSFIDGMSTAEIAEAMGLAYQSIQNQKSRGIRLLKTALIKDNLLSPAILAACLLLLEEKSLLVHFV